MNGAATPRVSELVTFFTHDKTSYLHETDASGKGSYLWKHAQIAEKMRIYVGFPMYHSAFSVREDLLPVNAEGKRTLKQYRGPHAFTLDQIPFDFDSESDPAAALQDALKLIAHFNLSNIASLYFSGSKGFHVYLPVYAVPTLQKSSTPNALLKRFAKEIKEELTLQTLDLSLYDIPRKLRMPGSRHDKTGLFKVALPLPSVDENLDDAARAFKELAQDERLAHKSFAHWIACADQSSIAENTLLESRFEALAVYEEWAHTTPDGTPALSAPEQEDSGFIKAFKALARKPCTERLFEQQAPVGVRHEVMKRIVSDFFHQGMKPEEIRHKMRDWMIRQGQGAETSEADRFLSELQNGAGYNYTCSDAIRSSKCSAHCPMFKRLGAKTLEGRVLPSDIDTKTVEKALQKTATLQIKKYVDSLIAEKRVVFHIQSHEFMLHAGTHYQKLPEEVLASWFERDLKAIATNKNVQEFLGTIKRSHQISEEAFDSCRKAYVNFKNGVFNKRTGILEQRTALHVFNYCLPYDYDPDAKAPAWEAFLEKVFWTASGVDKERVQVLETVIGYTLSGDDPWLQSCIFLTGDGSNGKSTVLDLVRSMLGDDSVCGAASISDLSRPERRVSLVGKLANIKSDEEKSALKHSSGLFKELVAGDRTEARPLYAKRSFTFRPIAKFWIGCNELPTTFDSSHGFKRRNVILNFDSMFYSADELKEREKVGTLRKNDFEKDPWIKDRLLAEIPGIFNRAWIAYCECKRLGQLPQSRAVNEAREAYADTQDALGLMISKTFVADPESRISNAEIIQNFYAAAESWGSSIKNTPAQGVLNAVRRAFPRAKRYRTGVERGFTGIRYNPSIIFGAEKAAHPF